MQQAQEFAGSGVSPILLIVCMSVMPTPPNPSAARLAGRSCCEGGGHRLTMAAHNEIGACGAPACVPHDSHVELEFRGDQCFLVHRLTGAEHAVGHLGTQLGFNDDGLAFVSPDSDSPTTWVSSIFPIDAKQHAGRLILSSSTPGEPAPAPEALLRWSCRYVSLQTSTNSRLVVKVYIARWYITAAQLWWQVRDLQGSFGVACPESKSTKYAASSKWILDSWRYWSSLSQEWFPRQPLISKPTKVGEQDWRRPFDEASFSTAGLILVCLWRSHRGRPEETRSLAVVVLRAILDKLFGGSEVDLPLDLSDDMANEAGWLAMTAHPSAAARVTMSSCMLQLPMLMDLAEGLAKAHLSRATKALMPKDGLVHIADLLHAMFPLKGCKVLVQQLIVGIAQSSTPAFDGHGSPSNPMDCADMDDFAKFNNKKRVDVELWRRLSMGEGPSTAKHVHCAPEENARGFFRFRLHSGLQRGSIKNQVLLNQSRTLNSYLAESRRIMTSSSHISICTDAARIGGKDILAILICCFSEGRWVCFWAPPQVV